MDKKSDFEKFWLLAGKKLSGEANDRDNERLNQFLISYKELNEIYHFLEENWSKIEHYKLMEKINVQEDWLNLKAKIERINNTKITISLYKKILPYAATAAIFLATSVFLLWQNLKNDTRPVQYTHIKSPLGSKSNLVLPDGTSIWLNAGSEIQFNNLFNSGNREVFLTGEAFFEVPKTDIPFIVKVPGIDFNVLGTSFNIKAYPEEDIVETTLVSGSIKVENTDEQVKQFKNFILEPNQKAVFWKKEGSLSIQKTENKKEAEARIKLPKIASPKIEKISISSKPDLEAEVGWVEGIIVVEKEPLNDLVRRLERLYDVEFVFQDSALEQYQYTGRLKELTLEQVLKAMKLTSPIDFIIEEKRVVIRENPLTKSKYKQFTKTK